MNKESKYKGCAQCEHYRKNTNIMLRGKCMEGLEDYYQMSADIFCDNFLYNPKLESRNINEHPLYNIADTFFGNKK